MLYNLRELKFFFQILKILKYTTLGIQDAHCMQAACSSEFRSEFWNCYVILQRIWIRITFKNYTGSSLSMNFGILKKSYYAKFVLVSTTQPISTSTNLTTQQFHQSPTSTNFIPMATKIRISGNRTSGDRTSGGPAGPCMLFCNQQKV